MELLFAILLAWLIASVLFPKEFVKPTPKTSPVKSSSGLYQVLKVADGDTVTIRYPESNTGKLKIRLNGIDAPEHSMHGKPEQPYAKESQALLTKLCSDGVILQITGTEKWGRTLAWLYTPSGLCINSEMVRQGAAWYYEQFCKNNRTLAAYQAEAQKNRWGLWDQKNPQAPWDYRKSK